MQVSTTSLSVILSSKSEIQGGVARGVAGRGGRGAFPGDSQLISQDSKSASCTRLHCHIEY